MSSNKASTYIQPDGQTGENVFLKIQEDEKHEDEKHEEEKIEGERNVEEEEWQVQLKQSKSKGDDAFRKYDYATAISHYTQALSLDPNNYIILSNRSAAYLSNHERSKALADARLCIKSNPGFVKGYNRCASAVVSLGRFNEGLELYRKVLKEIDPNNAIAKKGIEDCQKKLQKIREYEIESVRLKVEMDKEKERLEKEKKEQQKQTKKIEKTNLEEDDGMDDFFSEVETAVKQSKTKAPLSPSKVTTENNKSDSPSSQKDKRDKFQLNNIKLSSSKDQISYILQPSHTWLNLNPFHVLSIPFSQALSPHCKIDKIEKRYRAISLLIHPDKNLDNIQQAELAFDELKKAMDILRKDDRRDHAIQLISQGLKAAKKTPPQPPSLTTEEWQEKCIKKIFAQVEQNRREVEQRKKKQEEREQNQEMEEIAKLRKEKDFEKNWKEKRRVEKRVGNWRDFQGHAQGNDSNSSSKRRKDNR